MSNNNPWVVKHRPKTLDEIAGNKAARESLKEWVLSWKRNGRGKKASLLYGPPGSGKTVTAEAIARDLDFDLIEMNASDYRTEQIIERIVGSAADQQSLFQKNKLILLDEVDGISRKDQGAAQAIIKIIGRTNFPILMTANDAWDPKIRSLREKSELIEFKKVGIREAVPFLRQLLTKEEINFDDQMLKIIIDRNKGDMRSIVNDLQTLTSGRTKLSFEGIDRLAWRDRNESIFNALNLVFSSTNCINARRALDVADTDYEMFFEWIYENLPRQLSDPSDLAKAMENLSKADLYIARIKKTQEWGLLSYVIDLMTAGVALSRERTKRAWVPMKYPQRISFMARSRRERALRAETGKKIGEKCHISSNRGIKEYLPYLKIIFNKNKEMESSIQKWLELDQETAEYIKRK